MSKTYTGAGSTKFMPELGGVMLSLLLATTGIATRAADLSKPLTPDEPQDGLNAQLDIALRKPGSTGKIESTLVARLGRPIDKRLGRPVRTDFPDPVHAESTRR